MKKINLQNPNCNVAVSIPLFSLPGLALGSSGTFAEAKEKATSAWNSPHRHSIGWFRITLFKTLSRWNTHRNCPIVLGVGHPLRKKHASLPSQKSLPCTSPPLTIRGLSEAQQKLAQSGVTTRRPTTATLWLRCLQQWIVCDAEVLDVLLHKLFCPHQLFIGQMAKRFQKVITAKSFSLFHDVPQQFNGTLMMLEIPNASTCEVR